MERGELSDANQKNTTHLSRCCQTSQLLLNIVILLFLAPYYVIRCDLRQIAADFPAQLRTAVRHYIYSE